MTNQERSEKGKGLASFIQDAIDKGATTVEEIATAAGVSHMTFFRYFPRKESVVETREYDPIIEELIVDRPQDEPPLVAIRAAVLAALAAILPSDRDRWLARVRLVMGKDLVSEGLKQ